MLAAVNSVPAPVFDIHDELVHYPVDRYKVISNVLDGWK